MLTKKQKELLTYIQTFQSKNGLTPSYEEMKSALNLKSKSGIHRLIVLEERGLGKDLRIRQELLKLLRMEYQVLRYLKKIKKI